MAIAVNKKGPVPHKWVCWHGKEATRGHTWVPEAAGPARQTELPCNQSVGFIGGLSYWVEKVPDAIGRARMLLPAPGRLLSQYLPCVPTNSLTFQGSAERASPHQSHDTHSGHCMVPKCAQADFDARPGSSSSFLIGPRGV